MLQTCTHTYTYISRTHACTLAYFLSRLLQTQCGSPSLWRACTSWVAANTCEILAGQDVAQYRSPGRQCSGWLYKHSSYTNYRRLHTCINTLWTVTYIKLLPSQAHTNHSCPSSNTAAPPPPDMYLRQPHTPYCIHICTFSHAPKYTCSILPNTPPRSTSTHLSWVHHIDEPAYFLPHNSYCWSAAKWDGSYNYMCTLH